MKGNWTIALTALAGCDDGVATDVPRTVDAAVVAARALTFADGGFTRVTREAQLSRHMGADVHVWVSDDALAAYLAITPDTEVVASRFPEGAMIVKEQLAEDGGVPSLTVMYKGPAGSGAASDDWFWERIEPTGDVSFSGEVDFCIGCHTPRANVDWVFGVVEDNRAR